MLITFYLLKSVKVGSQVGSEKEMQWNLGVKRSFLRDQSNKMLQGRQAGRCMEVWFIFSVWSKIELQNLRELMKRNGSKQYWLLSQFMTFLLHLKFLRRNSLDHTPFLLYSHFPYSINQKTLLAFPFKIYSE